MTLIFALQSEGKDKAYQLGYELGYWVGQNPIITLLILGAIFAAFTFLLVRFLRKRRMRSL